jgi:hypothetical protein
MGGLIAAGISLVTSVVKGWSERRRVKAETKMRIEEARANAEIARLQRMAEAEIDWDTVILLQSCGHRVKLLSCLRRRYG